MIICFVFRKFCWEVHCDACNPPENLLRFGAPEWFLIYPFGSNSSCRRLYPSGFCGFYTIFWAYLFVILFLVYRVSATSDTPVNYEWLSNLSFGWYGTMSNFRLKTQALSYGFRDCGGNKWADLDGVWFPCFSLVNENIIQLPSMSDKMECSSAANKSWIRYLI